MKSKIGFLTTLPAFFIFYDFCFQSISGLKDRPQHPLSAKRYFPLLTFRNLFLLSRNTLKHQPQDTLDVHPRTFYLTIIGYGFFEDYEYSLFRGGAFLSRAKALRVVEGLIL